MTVSITCIVCACKRPGHVTRLLQPAIMVLATSGFTTYICPLQCQHRCLPAKTPAQRHDLAQHHDLATWHCDHALKQCSSAQSGQNVGRD